MHCLDNISGLLGVCVGGCLRAPHFLERDCLLGGPGKMGGEACQGCCLEERLAFESWCVDGQAEGHCTEPIS